MFHLLQSNITAIETALHIRNLKEVIRNGSRDEKEEKELWNSLFFCCPLFVL